MGYGVFMLIFSLFLFWLEIGTESSYLDLAFWAKGLKDQGLNDFASLCISL